MMPSTPIMGVMTRRPKPTRDTNEPDGSGTFLRAWRKNRKMSQEQLAAKAGYTQGMISQWESGAVTLDLEHIQSLAGALDITPKQLQFRSPAEDESIEDIYDDLPAAERTHMIEIAKAMRKTARN